MANPAYVERDGQTILVRPPYLQSNAFLSGWMLDADITALQAVLDQALNHPSGGAVRYEALFPKVLFTFANIQKVTSLDAQDAQKGFATEGDVCIWIPAAAYKNGKIDRIVFYLPYIVVTDAIAVTIGREVYGFPKMLGEAVMPTAPGDEGPFTAKTYVIEKYAPASPVTLETFLTVSQGKAAPTPPPPDPPGFVELVEMILAELKKDLAPAAVAHDLEAILAMIKDAIRAQLPCVFLKQLRDSATSNLAAYQAIVEANATITHVSGVGLQPLGWTFAFEEYDTLKIPTTLGMSAQQNVTFGFWVDFSFSMDLGAEVWRAS